VSKGTNSEDVFAKIKGLIADMIDKLEDAAAADATKKARCDKDLGETNAKKDDKEAEKDKLTTKMDQNMADSAKLKEEVATLQKELAALANGQKEADDIREKEKAVYDKNRPEMEQGLAGIKAALKVLRDYYAKDAAHGSSGGAASGIIGLLEVAESDFSKGLSEMIAEEESSQKEYTDMTNENEVTRATKDQDVKYKTKESKSLDKKASDLKSDLGTLDDELNAVYDYLKELRAECVPKAETYEDRKARREAEIAGLKEALDILSSPSSLLQVNAGSRVGRVSLRR
jgi:chromosome segregation ATPase